VIKKIRVKNFKSFKDIELNLGKVNILIGANGSGKSNFVDIFRFLKDILKEGWENAISMHGELKYIRNVNIDIPENLLIEIMFNKGIPYTINIEFVENGYRYVKINEDNKIIEYEPYTDKFGKKMNLTINEQLSSIDEKSLDFKSICIYDSYSKLSKKAPSIFVKADLEEDGSNLVIVIKKILDDPEKKRMFLNLVSYLLPYIEDIEVEKFTETHFYIKIRETYSEHYLPAPLISDGTINALGLVVALYFQESPLIIIEEPDRGFHPSLISRVMSMIKDASKNKQIIVTTHNPVMVKHADTKDVLLVSRDEKGFSKIIRPSRKKDVKAFLENGMRFEELYVNELLEI